MHHLAWPTSKWILPLIACYPLLPKPQPFSSTSFRFKEETEGVKGIVHFYPDIYTSWRPMCYIFYLFILLLVARLCLPIWAENEFFFYLYFIFYFYNCITELSTCQPQFWPSRSLAPRKPISNFERFKNIVLLYKELDDTCYQSIFCSMQILFFCIFSKMHYDLEAVFWQDNLLHSVD